MIYANVPPFFGLGLENVNVPTFWLLLEHSEVLQGRRPKYHSEAYLLG